MNFLYSIVEKDRRTLGYSQWNNTNGMKWWEKYASRVTRVFLNSEEIREVSEYFLSTEKCCIHVPRVPVRNNIEIQSNVPLYKSKPTDSVFLIIVFQSCSNFLLICDPRSE